MLIRCQRTNKKCDRLHYINVTHSVVQQKQMIDSSSSHSFIKKPKSPIGKGPGHVCASRIHQANKTLPSVHPSLGSELQPSTAAPQPKQTPESCSYACGNPRSPPASCGPATAS